MSDNNNNDITNKQTEEFLNLESLIRSYLTKIEGLRKDLKQNKEIYDDSFNGDAVYNEQAEKAKEAAKVKSSTKMEILKRPELAEVSSKIDELRAEIKEAEEILSDYLLQFQKSTGLNEIETNEGETMIIVTKARLVKGSTEKNT